jgi:hypothetical protein
LHARTHCRGLRPRCAAGRGRAHAGNGGAADTPRGQSALGALGLLGTTVARRYIFARLLFDTRSHSRGRRPGSLLCTKGHPRPPRTPRRASCPLAHSVRSAPPCQCPFCPNSRWQRGRRCRAPGWVLKTSLFVVLFLFALHFLPCSQSGGDHYGGRGEDGVGGCGVAGALW